MPVSNDISSRRSDHRLPTSVAGKSSPSAWLRIYLSGIVALASATLLLGSVFKLSVQTPAEILARPEVQSAMHAVKAGPQRL
jgi:hypothetical protein